MQQLRLMGLALFITAIFLALSAAITKTTHIRIQRTSSEPQTTGQSESVVLPPPKEPGFVASEPQPDLNAIQFISVPIVWPLIIAAGVGLLMWFMLASNPRSRLRRLRR